MLPLTQLLAACTVAAAVAAQYQHGGNKRHLGQGPLRVEIPVGSRFVGRQGHDCGCGRRVQQSSHDDFDVGSLSIQSGSLGQSGIFRLGSEMSTGDVAEYRGEQSDIGLGSGKLAGQSSLMGSSMNIEGQSALSGIVGKSAAANIEINGLGSIDSLSGSEDSQAGKIVGEMGTLGQGRHTAVHGAHPRQGANHRHIIQSIIRGIQSGSLTAHIPHHDTHPTTHSSQIQSNIQDQTTAQASTSIAQSTSRDAASSSHASVQSSASSRQIAQSGHSGAHSSGREATSSSHATAQSRASSGHVRQSAQSSSQDLDITDYTNSNSQANQSLSQGGESSSYEVYSRGPWGRRGRYSPKISA